MTASFLNRPSELICVWPGDDYAAPQYGGEVVVVPPTNEVAEAGKGVFRFGPALDRSGKPIPGTALIRDVTRINDKGEQEKLFNAQVWATGIYDVNKPLLARGFSIVSAPEEVPQAKAEGRPKWRRAKRQEYDSILRAEQARRQGFKDRGQNPMDLSPEDAEKIRRATAELVLMRQEDAVKQVSDADLVAAIGGPSAIVAPAPVAKDAFELESMRDLLWKQAKDYGLKLNSAEKEGFLELDVAVLQAVNEKLAALKAAKATEQVAVGA